MQASAPPPTPQELAAHGQNLERAVLEVRPHVWVAVGYGQANAILLEGETGAVLVDTLGSIEQGRVLRAAFAEVCAKPIVGIIYTHHHSDHIGGARAFEEGGQSPQRFAHTMLMQRLADNVHPLGLLRDRQRARWQGTQLTQEEYLHGGIGLGPDHGTPGFLAPTTEVSEPTTVELGGLRLQLIPAPGETSDHLAVWVEEWQVLLPGDNFYRAFPWIPPEEGRASEVILRWSATLERLRDLGSVHLVPSHTRPVSGQDAVAAALTNHRDAMRWVRDQTLRAMHMGMGVHAIASEVRMPPDLAASPDLRPFYGTPGWMARAVFTGEMGGSEEDPAALQPVSATTRARHLAELAGGPERLRAAAAKALQDNQAQWALELSAHLRALDAEDDSAVALQARALEMLAGQSNNAPARHVYLTVARELQGKVKQPTVQRVPVQRLREVPLANFFDVLATRLDGRLAAEKNVRLNLSFPDVNEHYTLWIRNGVLEVRSGTDAQAPLHLALDAQAFKEMVMGERNATRTLGSESELRKGGRIELMQFFATFQLRGPVAP